MIKSLLRRAKFAHPDNKNHRKKWVRSILWMRENCKSIQPWFTE